MPMPVHFPTVLFVTLGLLLAAGPPATSAPTADPSTPAAGYRTLLDAIDRDDAAAVADSVLLPIELRGADRTIEAERLALGSRVAWAIADRFGRDAADHWAWYAALAVVPRADVATVTFNDSGHPNRPGVVALAIGQSPHAHPIRMARVGPAWRYDRTDLASPFDIAFGREDAAWRHPTLRAALDGLRTGKIADEAALAAALVPPVTPVPAHPHPADRAVPSDVPWAVRIAVDAGDAAEVADCYDRPAAQDGDVRASADLEVLKRKLDRALHAKFGPAQGDRLVNSCNLATATITDGYANVQWAVDGDVARGLRDGVRLDPLVRMRRRAGRWRIERPFGRLPADVLSGRERAAALEVGRSIAADTAKDADVLAHLDRYPDPGSVLDELDVVQSEYAHRDPAKAQADAAARRAEAIASFARAEREFVDRRATMPQTERDQTEIQLSFQRQLFAAAAATRPVSLYVADGDPGGGYVVAREHRNEAAVALWSAADRNVDSGAAALAYEFTLTDAADEPLAMMTSTWTIDGDRATGRSPAGVGRPFWVPPLRRVAGAWKVDLTDETAGDPAAAAKRAEAEAVAIERVTADVQALRFQTLDDVRAALRAAHVRGTGKPM